jgi:hypothetical protein
MRSAFTVFENKRDQSADIWGLIQFMVVDTHQVIAGCEAVASIQAGGCASLDVEDAAGVHSVGGLHLLERPPV